MKLTDIAKVRLFSQQILSPNFGTVKALVSWMGAMQAQDYGMAKWAIGLRLPGLKEQDVEAAINRGEILRTHLLRPTWHFVSADDIYWMLELTAPQVKALTSSRERQLELSEAIFTKSNAVLERSLKGGRSLSREELALELRKAGIATEDNRLSHLLARAELDRVICSGVIQSGKPTYALLEERVPKPQALARETALAKLAQKYFSSHGPATVSDFSWWSGLTLREARQALEMVKTNLVSETVDSQAYWFDGNEDIPKLDGSGPFLIPAYDEYIISYKDRSALFPYRYHHKLISENGIFRPTILVDGQVRGMWKRTIKKNKAILEIDLFESPGETLLNLVEKASEPLGRFLDKQPEYYFIGQ